MAPGKIVTFYSYKGGVGRTMALANLAVVLSRWGYSTLMVDWDLEAPGLEYFFKDFVRVEDVAQHTGVIDYLHKLSEDGDAATQQQAWRQSLVSIPIGDVSKPPHLLTAGRRITDGRFSTSEYFQKVRDFDVKKFYTDKDGGRHIEALRKQMAQTYDLVLVDSRTGFTDIGGICTIQLPDILVLVFTATFQGFEGAVDVAKKAAAKRKTLPGNRFTLLTVPVPSRFDPKEEYRIAQEWLDRFAEGLSDIYREWLPRSVSSRAFLERTKIPYAAYFSFGEKLPVLETSMSDPTSLGFAYENIGALLALGLADVDMLLTERDHYVARAAEAKARAAEQMATQMPATDATPASVTADALLVEVTVTGMLKAHGTWVASAGKQGKIADLSKASLIGRDLRGQNLTNAILSGANLSGAQLQGAILTQATLSGASLIRADLTGAQLNNALLQGADLTEASVVGADLGGANLQGATLQFANLTRARLADATLRDAKLHGVKLRGADLQRVDLTTTRDLGEQQLAGTNLADAKVPDALREFQSLSETRGLARYVSRAHGALLLACAYVVIAVTSIDNLELLGMADLRLPLLGFRLSPVAFFALIPALILAGHLSVNLLALQLARSAARLPAVFPDGRRAHQRIPAGAGLYLVSMGRAGHELASLAVIRTYWSFLFWGVVPLVLLYCAFKYLPRQDGAGLTLLVALLAVSLVIAIAAPAVINRVAEADDPFIARDDAASPARRFQRELRLLPRGVGMLLIVTVVVALGLAVMSWSGAFWRSSSPLEGITTANVAGMDLSTKLVGWQPGDTTAVQGAQLNGRSLYGLYAPSSFAVKANLSRAHLPYAVFNSADLTAADLRGAVLRNAYLSRAVFFSTRLDSALMRSVRADYADFRRATLVNADLEGAELDSATFEGADLRGAELRGSSLINTVMTDAVLTEASLREAILTGARLGGADLRGADLTAVYGWNEVADLRLANLAGARGLTPEMRRWAIDSAGAVEAATDSAWNRIRQPVDAVVVTPQELSLMIGGTAPLLLRVLDANGNPLDGRRVHWIVMDTSIASVTPAGLVRGLRAGRTTVRVTAEGVEGVARVTVTRPTPRISDTMSVSQPSREAAAALVAQVTVAGGEAVGSGIAFGSTGTLVFIVVPGHVVRGSDRAQQAQQSGRDLLVRFQGMSLPVTARVLERSDPSLDLAVLTAALPPGLGKALLASVSGLTPFEAKTQVFLAQVQARGVTLTPGIVTDVQDRSFLLDTRTSQMPLAGTAVISARGDLIGMVMSQRSRLVEVVRMDRVLESLARLEYPISLRRRQAAAAR